MNPDIIYIKRDLEKILPRYLGKGKVIILYGARQVGKTTLLKKLFSNKNSSYFSCDQLRVREQLIPDSLSLNRIIGDYQNLIFDEAQYLPDPGLFFKILIDNFPQRNIIASGSSSFELAHKLSEPLTGRHFKFLLFPLSFKEISQSVSPLDLQFYLNQAFLYGTYPGVYNQKGIEDKIMNLTTLTEDYLYKDILAFNLVRNSGKIHDLLLALALQLGNEVSYTELANTVGLDRKTIESYLDLLEKSFVIFRLYGFSRNLRSEINRKVKIYFYDLGVRNSLVNNFNELKRRNDVGAIFENFFISQMVIKEANMAQKTNFYFWRTYQQKELDLIAEKNGQIFAYECKFSEKRSLSKATWDEFQKSYPGSLFTIVSPNSLPEVFKRA